MNISTETQTLLKNFALINRGILITPGNKLWSRTPSVFGEAVVTETFPLEVGIFDINNLLAVFTLYKEPDLDFREDCLYITEENGNVVTRFGYAGSGAVSLPYPKKHKPIADEVIDFTITEEQWIKIQKAISIFQKPEIKIVSDGQVLRIGTANHKSDLGNSFSFVLESDPKGIKCNMVFAKEHLTFLKGAYSGTITPEFSIFKNLSGFDLTYLVGCEPTTSNFNGK